MGINISIYREDSHGKMQEHSTWDFCRYAGDRDLPSVLNKVGEVQLLKNEFDYYVRPIDVETFRVALHEANNSNHERWDELAKILEDPQQWLYLGG